MPPYTGLCVILTTGAGGGGGVGERVVLFPLDRFFFAVLQEEGNETDHNILMELAPKY